MKKNVEKTMAESSSLHHARIRAVFSGRWPDRLPICEQAFASSVASTIFAREMYTGSTDLHFYEGLAWLKGEAAHDEFVEKLYEDTIALHRFFDFDILFLPWRMSERPTKQVDEYSLLYGNPDENDWCIRRLDSGSRTYGVVKTAGPPPTCEEVIRCMRSTIKDASRRKPSVEIDPLLLRATKEYGSEFVIGGCSFMSIPMQSEWLEASLLESELMGEYLDYVVETNLASMELQRKNGIWLFNGGGDFAYNTGPIYSPKFFKEFMAPRWKRLFDWCRAHDTKYIFRSDGNLWPVADSLFGWAQPHAYYEVDYDAGMRFDKLRKRFPELVLIGNVSCDILRRGTADDVRKMTLECLEAAAPGFIGASANSILHETPPEDVFALYETVKKYSSRKGIE